MYAGWRASAQLETFAGKLGVALVDSRKGGGKVTPMKRLHDR